MAERNSRDRILNRIKEALKQPSSRPYPDLAELPANEQFTGNKDEDLAVIFAEEFTRLGGHFIYCMNMREVVQNLETMGKSAHWDRWYCRQPKWKEQLERNGFKNTWWPDLPESVVAVTGCECLVARTGSMFLTTNSSGGRATSVYAPVHVCIAYANQLVFDISDGIDLLQQKYGSKLPPSITLASGPSRTADIEKTLVTGVHGPKEVFCFLVEQE